MNNSKSFVLSVTVLYALALAVITYLHEPWRDELHAWAIVLASNSFEQLIENTRYEGHPMLWFTLLYAVSKITVSYIGMQVLNWVISVATAYVLLRYAPFTRLQRFLLVFGYFFFYEYGVISRNYQIGILLFFLFFVVYFGRSPNKIYYLAGLAFLLAQSNLFAVALTCSISLLALKLWVEKGISLRQFAVYCTVTFIGIALSVSQMHRAQGEGLRTNGFQFDVFRSCLMTFLKAVFPVPVLSDFSNWNSVLKLGLTQYILLALLIVFVLVRFSDSKWALAILGSYFLLSFAVYYFIYYGFARHHGHFYILLIGCIWITELFKPEKRPVSIFLLTTILTIQALVCVYFSVKDCSAAFSQIEACSNYVKETFTKDDVFYVGYNDYTTEGISLLSGKRIYFPSSNSYNPYVIWGVSRRYDFFDDITCYNMCLAEAKRTGKRKILFIINQEPTKNTEARLGKRIRTFEPSIVGDENFYLYLKE